MNGPSMKTLDLHGTRHHQVERRVEDFVFRNPLPVLIITGNSPSMKKIVWSVLENHGFYWEYQNDWNLGAIVVKDGSI
jgi:transposase